MSVRIIIWLVCLGLLLVSIPSAAFACSVSRDYVRPSNYELVELADVIAIVTPIRQKRVGDGDREVTFRVDRALKGNVGSTFKNVGWVNIGKGDPSDPNDISLPHPEVFAGPCNRITFRKGQQYIFFLKSGAEGKLTTLGYPFSRISEDYYGENSLWAEAIDYYLEVQSENDPMAALEVLQQRYNSLMASNPSERDQKLATDIADHLMSRSPFKPTEYLLQSYYALDENKELPFSVRSPQADKEQSDAQRLTDLLYGSSTPEEFGRNEQMQFILWALVNGDHPSAMELFDGLSKENNQNGAVLGTIIRFFSKHGRYRDAVNVANNNAFRVMSTSPRRDVEEFLRGVNLMHYYEGDYLREKWKEDAYAKAWWPEFALAINESFRNRFGGDRRYSFGEEAELLRPENYRSRPLVTLALADAYDDAVINWAKSEIDRFIALDSDEIDNYFLDLPVLVLLHNYRSYKKETIEPVDEYFCADEDVRYKIISLTGLAQNYYTEDLLYRIAQYDGLEGYEPTYLKQAMILFVAERQKRFLEGGRGFFGGYGMRMYGMRMDELLIPYMNGEKIEEDDEDRKPIVCEGVQ